MPRRDTSPRNDGWPPADRRAQLEAARLQLGLSTFALWVRGVGIGGELSYLDHRAVLRGHAELADADASVLEQALAEAAMDADG